jgi:hypothetical protein
MVVAVVQEYRTDWRRFEQPQVLVWLNDLVEKLEQDQD